MKTTQGLNGNSSPRLSETRQIAGFSFVVWELGHTRRGAATSVPAEHQSLRSDATSLIDAILPQGKHLRTLTRGMLAICGNTPNKGISRPHFSQANGGRDESGRRARSGMGAF
jgi:hypothetical protein